MAQLHGKSRITMDYASPPVPEPQVRGQYMVNAKAFKTTSDQGDTQVDVARLQRTVGHLVTTAMENTGLDYKDAMIFVYTKNPDVAKILTAHHLVGGDR